MPPRRRLPRASHQPDNVGEGADCQRRQRQLRRAEAEYGTAERHQPAKLELQTDQEQQHHHAKLGDRDDALGRAKCGQAMRTDHDAGDEIGDDGG